MLPLMVGRTSVLSLLVVVGCQNDEKAACDCADQGLFIELTPERSAQVAVIYVNGPACTASHAECVGYQGTNCIRYFVRAGAIGNCHVELSFKAPPARLGGDVTFIKGGTPGCCEGFYPQGSSTMTLGEVKDDAGFD